jgi:hypothetical protein
MNLTIQIESWDVICPLSIMEKCLGNEYNNSNRFWGGYLFNFDNEEMPGE